MRADWTRLLNPSRLIRTNEVFASGEAVGTAKMVLYAPRNVVPFEVHDSEHADFSGSNSVEDAVRKPAQNGMPDFAMHDLILLWVS